MNERVIKVAHLGAVAALVLAAAIAVARQGSGTGQQNTNRSAGQQNRNANRQAGDANGNVNSNANVNTGDSMNANMGQNMNSNAGNTDRGGNTNSGGGNMNADRGTAGRGAVLGSIDRRFVTDAAMSGMAEVELGKLAVERGASDAVKQFGQRMVDDHTRANEELMRLASDLGITLPAVLDAKHRAVVSKLSRLSGAAFDRAYAKQMVTDHQAAVSLFRREADRGGHAELKTFAGGKLPALEEHLRMARELAGGDRGGRTTGVMR